MNSEAPEVRGSIPAKSWSVQVGWICLCLGLLTDSLLNSGVIAFVTTALFFATTLVLAVVAICTKKFWQGLALLGATGASSVFCVVTSILLHISGAAEKEFLRQVEAKTGITENTTLRELIGPEKRSLRVNINTASSKELESLPNVGPARADIIIAHRPYASVDDLVGLKSITQTAFEEFRPYIKTDGETEKLEPPPPIPDKRSLRVNINTASLEELESLPNIGSVRAELMIAKRPYESVDDLVKIKGITQRIADDLRPYVKTEGLTEKIEPTK